MKRSLLLAALASVAACSRAAGIRFVVVDPVSGSAIPDGVVTIQPPFGSIYPVDVRTGACFDTSTWSLVSNANVTLRIPLGVTRTLNVQDEPPVKDVYVTVSAKRMTRPKSDAAAGSTRTKEEISKFGGAGGGDVKNVTKSTAGVAEDSGGQPHIRGEHTEITYVVDDIPLPDALSGRQGSIVASGTIESVDILLGGFAPEFGGQTAAILNILTTPRPRVRSNELIWSGGSFGTSNGSLTAMGPVGDKFGYVVSMAANRSQIGTEGPQPDQQAAHNAGSDESLFGKFSYQPNVKDRLTLTVSANPDRLQIANRTGLGDAFSVAGQGYGFLGLRNKDGTRPDVDATKTGLLGADPIAIGSQDQVGMDINQREANEFATLSWRRQIDANSVGQLGLVFLHSGQDVTNANPAVDQTNLPVDNSIEYNPTASRNVHHVQLTGNLTTKHGAHTFKAGFLADQQSGDESYNIASASQLALDALAATAPSLAPAGATNGKIDVNGNPVYIASSNVVPTLNVHREGHYYAAFAQDTWKISNRLTANYGVRGDWYRQSQTLGQPTVDAFELSPRVNLSYQLTKRDLLRVSYNKLFNTPPLAQGAIIGQPLQPPIVTQYDVSVERQIAKNQTLKVAYYYKQIKNQIDVGLLIPGSTIGLYSGVNLGEGGVHGLEVSYDVSSTKTSPWDAYVNFTLSAARPNGVDNTGAPVGDFNDHDQRTAVGIGLAYSFKSGATASLTFDYGSGLASSIVAPNEDRTSRTETSLHLNSGDRLFKGRGGLAFDILNVFDARNVINFQSAFSGTRFQTGRRFQITANFKF